MIFCKLKDMKQNVVTLTGLSFYILIINHLGKYISEANIQVQEKKNAHVVIWDVMTFQ